MAMRLTGLMSGMDTDSVIQELVQVRRTKLDTAIKAQTKLQWKQDAWKALNSKVVKLYNNTLSNLRFQGSYAKKTTKVSNSNAVSVITGSNAANSVQSLKVKELARAGYLTGSVIDSTKTYKASDKLVGEEESALGLTAGASFEISVGGKTTAITIDENTTISNFTSSLQKAGVNASFDEKNQRFFISSTSTGAENDFTLVGLNAEGIEALDKMGISTYGNAEKSRYEDYALRSDEMLEERLNNTLEALTEEYKELTTTKDSLMSSINDYRSYMRGVDRTDADAIRERIAEIKKNPSEYELKTTDDDYKALMNRETDSSANDKALTSLEENWNVTIDDTGDLQYALDDSLLVELTNEFT